MNVASEWIKIGKENQHAWLVVIEELPHYCDTMEDVEGLCDLNEGKEILRIDLRGTPTRRLRLIR